MYVGDIVDAIDCIWPVASPSPDLQAQQARLQLASLDILEDISDAFHTYLSIGGKSAK